MVDDSVVHKLSSYFLDKQFQDFKYFHILICCNNYHCWAILSGFWRYYSSNLGFLVVFRYILALHTPPTTDKPTVSKVLPTTAQLVNWCSRKLIKNSWFLFTTFIPHFSMQSLPVSFSLIYFLPDTIHPFPSFVFYQIEIYCKIQLFCWNYVKSLIKCNLLIID